MSSTRHDEHAARYTHGTHTMVETVVSRERKFDEPICDLCGEPKDLVTHPWGNCPPDKKEVADLRKRVERLEKLVGEGKL